MSFSKMVIYESSKQDKDGYMKASKEIPNVTEYPAYLLTSPVPLHCGHLTYVEPGSARLPLHLLHLA